MVYIDVAGCWGDIAMDEKKHPYTLYAAVILACTAAIIAALLLLASGCA